ncbi:alpha/beta hydrolase [Frigidibacter sp. SD6-1]|uniref:alpha/beta fold hydrolase n=1 Tax=Frigidibacter sp. SD6-1 TaxID=3032581 RepID=UPI0024DFDAA3|nr:alpha/beta hydrolase [Frigidibacter sp. SD6-1]
MIATLYLHGLPGGAAELDLGGSPSGWIVPDRLAWTDYDTGVTQLAARLPEQCRLIGFSIGAMTALRLAARAPDRVVDLTLISPAAPLETGDFLPDMAGRKVFEAARRGGWPFRALTAAQSLIARSFPRLLMQMLFAGTTKAEKFLADAHSSELSGVIATTYGSGRAAYLDELQHYVRPWRGVLAGVRAAVTVHHGEADNWSPPAMGAALVASLPDAKLIRYPELGHYGTLATFLEQEGRFR